MWTKIDLLGKRFGRLLVIKEAPSTRRSDGHSSIRWLCKCDCGNEKTAQTKLLRNGKTTSCGCYASEWITKKNFKHGASCRNRITSEYHTWSAMISRCTNPNDKEYRNYGGRGIEVCTRWRGSFKAFLMDMGEKPSKKHSIERVRNNGNYEPDNCIWVTIDRQAINKRNNVVLTYNGQTMAMTQLWRQVQPVGISLRTFTRRIRRGWNAKEAFELPLNFKLKG